MKFLTLAFVTLFSVIALGADLFSHFGGNYAVDERWCAGHDLDCLNLMTVRVTQNRYTGETLLVETYRNGGTITYTLWEGSTGDEQASISGTAGQDAQWTYSRKLENLTLMQNLKLYRTEPASPVYYAFTRTSSNKDHPRVTRKFRLED